MEYRNQNVDMVPVDLSDKFSLASLTHLVLFLEDNLILFLDFMLFFFQISLFIDKMQVDTR